MTSSEGSASDDTKPESTKPKVGDRIADGTVYAGISPDTGKAMYAMPVDEPLTYTFSRALQQAEVNNMANALGHHDWRVPTKGELNVLFQNRAAIGGFNESGSYPASWYWSSTQTLRLNAWDQRFTDGHQSQYFEGDDKSLRCVR